MRLFISFFILIVGMTACKESSQNVAVETPHPDNEITVRTDNTPGDFAHNVYFWLKQPESDVDRLAFLISLRKFVDQSPYIQTMHIGTPAVTDRDVIDSTYDYSLLLTFADKAQQDKYQEEAAHKLFIEESEDLWEKVLVYDSENLLK